MARHPFKTPGIPRTGFEYQDLIGIEVLLRFYRDPELFHWVALEADEPNVGRLDDVVAARKDGTYELLQVKFTPDPATYLLDWDWLLHKKSKGTSLLKKWADALIAVKSLGPVYSAKLRTNRKPSADFGAFLTGGFVDFDQVENAQQAKLVAELGGEAAARAFFQRFEFVHSQALVDDLEARFMGEIVPSDTDHTGWLLLRDRARRWATRKNMPEPNGRVRHEHLVQIITKKRPQPIPQDFTIPSLYQVPSKRFNDEVTKRITGGSRPISVLWGSPGRGKSTYLSYLVRSLRKSGLISFAGALPKKRIEECRVDGATGWCAPVCLDLWPTSYGFWQSDYFHLGIACPAPYAFDAPLILQTEKGVISFSCAGKRAANWKVWHDNWSPIHTTEGHTRCGGLTEMKTATLNATAVRLGMKLVWLAKLSLWQRPTDYGAPVLSTQIAFFRE